MSRVRVAIAGHQYTIGCAPGQEERITALAEELEAAIESLREKIGDVGDRSLAVMAGLSALGRLAEADAANARLRARVAALERAHESAVLAVDADDEPLIARIEAAVATIDRLSGLFNRETRALGELQDAEARLRPVAVSPAAEKPDPDAGTEPGPAEPDGARRERHREPRFDGRFDRHAEDEGAALDIVPHRALTD